MARFHSDISPERMCARLKARSGSHSVPGGQPQVRLWSGNRFRLTFRGEHVRGKEALFEGRFRPDERGGTEIHGHFGGSVLIAAVCAIAFAPIGSVILADQLSVKWGYFHSAFILPGGEQVPFIPGILALWAAGAGTLFLLLYLMLCHQKREDNARLRAFLRELCDWKTDNASERGI